MPSSFIYITGNFPYAALTFKRQAGFCRHFVKEASGVDSCGISVEVETSDTVDVDIGNRTYARSQPSKKFWSACARAAGDEKSVDRKYDRDVFALEGRGWGMSWLSLSSMQNLSDSVVLLFFSGRRRWQGSMAKSKMYYLLPSS